MLGFKSVCLFYSPEKIKRITTEQTRYKQQTNDSEEKMRENKSVTLVTIAL